MKEQHKQKLRTFLLQLVQKEANVFPQFVELIRRVLRFMQSGLKPDELDRDLKLLRAGFNILVDNNKKEIQYVAGDTMREPLFRLTLRELEQLHAEIEQFVHRPNTELAQHIEQLLARLEQHEQEEADLAAA